jgi:hypothetical protein
MFVPSTIVVRHVAVMGPSVRPSCLADFSHGPACRSRSFGNAECASVPVDAAERGARDVAATHTYTGLLRDEVGVALSTDLARRAAGVQTRIATVDGLGANLACIADRWACRLPVA